MSEEQHPADVTRPHPPEDRDRLLSGAPQLGDVMAHGIRTISDLVEGIGISIAQMQSTFETKIKSDAHQAEHMDKLHAELQHYRQDFAVKLLNPMILDLVALHDDIGQMMDSYDVEQSAEVAGVLGAMEDIRIDIHTIIERYGYELYFSPDERFDKAVHRVQRVVPTDDPTQDYKIARRIKQGVRFGQRVVRPETVEIFRHKDSIGRS